MKDESGQFEILSVGEMRRKYYRPDEQPPKITLSPERVPESLRCLIPLAERWGITDDIIRWDTREKASAEEIAYLQAAIDRFADELDEWLAGPEAKRPRPSEEYVAFSAMRMAADGC